METALQPEITEIRGRISALEQQVGDLKRDLERIEIQQAIERGKDQADRGLVVPARELVASLRARYNLPST